MNVKIKNDILLLRKHLDRYAPTIQDQMVMKLLNLKPRHIVRLVDFYDFIIFNLIQNPTACLTDLTTKRVNVLVNQSLRFFHLDQNVKLTIDNNDYIYKIILPL